MGSQLAAQDKRKEKARIAARARRSQEASIIMEMANELHITQEKVRKIDKATIVKLAIDYIKAFEILCRFRNTNNGCNPIYDLYSCCSNSNSSGSSSDSSGIGSDNGDLTQEPVEPRNKQHQQQQQQQQQQQPEHAGLRVTRKRPHLQPLMPPQQQYHRHHQQQPEHEQLVAVGAESAIVPEVVVGAAVEIQPEQAIASDTTSTAPISTSTAAADLTSYSAPKLSTDSIFAPRTDDMDSFFLMIKHELGGKASFVLKPDTEIADEDDLSHLAPQAGDVSISLDVEPLEGIVLDTGLFGAVTTTPATVATNGSSIKNCNNNNNNEKTPLLTAKDLIETCCISGSIGTVN